MNRTYDLVVILEPEIKAEEQGKLLEKISKTVTDLKGEISGTKQLGKKELAYPILKKKEGIFVEVKFSLPQNSAPSLRQKLQLEEHLLRYLLVVEEPASVPPKAGLRAR